MNMIYNIRQGTNLIAPFSRFLNENRESINDKGKGQIVSEWNYLEGQ